MSNFIQLHLLTAYPPANLNRDDTGRPKTAVMGGAQRLRISSQSLKRAWRTSDMFIETLGEDMGKRTKELGKEVLNYLTEKGVDEKKAKKWTSSIMGVFGKVQKDGITLETLVFISPEERSAVFNLADKIAESAEEPTDEDLQLLREHPRAVDIAMFGRMLAGSPKYNVEASIQVAHAITTHAVAVEDDFFTAIDDLNNGLEDMGAGHMGETEFASGIFYIYICIDASLLLKNLKGDKDLTRKSLETVLRTATTVAPTGKQNSFASRARALYVVAERGTQQPRSMASAFIKPITGKDQLEDSIKNLNSSIEDMDKVYGKCADDRKTMRAVKPVEGSIGELTDFVGDDFDD